LISDSAGFELVEAEVGVLDPELFAIFDRNVIPRLNMLLADLKMLLYLVDDAESLTLTEELLVETASLKKSAIEEEEIGVGNFSHKLALTLTYFESPSVWATDNCCEISGLSTW
jgi:hypothetical protein